MAKKSNNIATPNGNTQKGNRRKKCDSSNLLPAVVDDQSSVEKDTKTVAKSNQLIANCDNQSLEVQNLHLNQQDIENLIYVIRGTQVMLDSDLAMLYGEETKYLKRAVRANISRFPEDFMFTLSREEFNDLRCKNGTSNKQGGTRYLPYAFTETGIAMLSSVLHSQIAVDANIRIMRAFVATRRLRAVNEQVFQRLTNIEYHQIETDKRIDQVFQMLESDIKPQQGIFFDGQIFDAYNFVSDLIRSAKKSIVLFDNYVDDTVLAMLDYPEGFHTNYWYDKLGRLVRRNHPDAGITEYTYDPAGNLTSESNGLGLILYDYSFNRLKKKRYSNLPGNNVLYAYNNAGRLQSVSDGSGSLQLTYDQLGNVATENRVITVPYDSHVYQFSMQYAYDSWGRLRSIVYPDGEQVEYNYQWGGDLYSVIGTKNHQSYDYVQSVLYNAIGQRDSIIYGDGSSARYGYNVLHRLDSLVCRDGSGIAIQDIEYTFDNVGNITDITDNGNRVNGLGGGYAATHSYDALNRLSISDCGGLAGSYHTEMYYTPSGRLTNVTSVINSDPTEKWYGYCSYDCPHAPRRIWDIEYDVIHELLWERTGNLLQRTTYNVYESEWTTRFLFWTDDNRLHTVADEEHYNYYVYDHVGERAIKVTGSCDLMDVNATTMTTTGVLDEVTLYPSPYLVLDNHGYTKHYYVGSDRLAARVGCGGLRHIDNLPANNTTAKDLFDQCFYALHQRVTNSNNEYCIQVPDPDAPTLGEMNVSRIPHRMQAKVSIDLDDFHDAMSYVDAPCNWPQNATWQEVEEVYTYHSDHLGSASWITDYQGAPVQHLQYMPFGQPFVDQRDAGITYQERYTFTGKERDEETGYGYFGARYMDHELMTMWLSVDPMSDKYPSISPYAYCAWNSVRLVDPDGCMIDDYFSKEGKFLGSDNSETKNVRIIRESDWNSLEQDDNGNVNHDLANQISTSFSDASAQGMSENAQLAVYQHYNITGEKVHAIPKENPDSRALGMQTSVGFLNGKTTIRLNVRLYGNRNTKACDNANNIINLFSHEATHIRKAKSIGYFRYANLQRNNLKSLEKSAISAQMAHPSWQGTSDKFKKWTSDYLNSFK